MGECGHLLLHTAAPAAQRLQRFAALLSLRHGSGWQDGAPCALFALVASEGCPCVLTSLSSCPADSCSVSTPPPHRRSTHCAPPCRPAGPWQGVINRLLPSHAQLERVEAVRRRPLLFYRRASRPSSRLLLRVLRRMQGITAGHEAGQPQGGCAGCTAVPALAPGSLPAARLPGEAGLHGACRPCRGCCAAHRGASDVHSNF